MTDNKKIKSVYALPLVKFFCKGCQPFEGWQLCGHLNFLSILIINQ